MAAEARAKRIVAIDPQDGKIAELAGIFCCCYGLGSPRITSMALVILVLLELGKSFPKWDFML
jgi:hypothetical protein